MSRTVQQGIDGGFVWELMDGDLPADLTGYTVKSQLRTSEEITETNLIQNLTTGIQAPNKVYISWLSSETLTWPSSAYFDVVLLWPDGRPRQTVGSERITLKKAVTHV